MKSINRVFIGGVCALLIGVQGGVLAAPKQQSEEQKLEEAYRVLFPKKTVKQKKLINRKTARAKQHIQIPARYRATQVAKKQIRKKYRWGGKTPKTGFDCSGLIQYAFKAVRVDLPRTARAQFKHTKRISLNKLQVGDLIFFHTRRTRAKVNHVGIYLGGGKFIHAPRKGKRVSVANLNKYWRRKAVGAGRV